MKSSEEQGPGHARPVTQERTAQSAFCHAPPTTTVVGQFGLLQGGRGVRPEQTLTRMFGSSRNAGNGRGRPEPDSLTRSSPGAEIHTAVHRFPPITMISTDDSHLRPTRVTGRKSLRRFLVTAQQSRSRRELNECTFSREEPNILVALVKPTGHAAKIFCSGFVRGAPRSNRLTWPTTDDDLGD